MGGDEVNFNCWKSVKTITDFMETKGYGTMQTNIFDKHDNFSLFNHLLLVKSSWSLHFTPTASIVLI